MQDRPLQKPSIFLEELVRQGYLKEYVLTPRAASDAGQTSALPPTQSHVITQYKAIEFLLQGQESTSTNDTHGILF